MKRIPNYLTAFLILLSLAPCPAQTNAATATKTSPKVKEHPQPQELYGPVIAANNQFAVRFFKAAYERSSQKNVLSLLLREMILLGRTRYGRLLLAVLIMSTVSVGQSPVGQSLVPTKFSIAGGKTSTTLPFELIDNRVFVEVHLNGRGPFHFILDTGANGFSLADTTVQKLGLQDRRSGRGPRRRRKDSRRPQYPSRGSSTR